MDKIDDKMDQFLTDLHSMKAQLVRVKSAPTSPAALKVSELEAFTGTSMFCWPGFNRISRGFA